MIINLLTSNSYKQITYLLDILFVTKILQNRTWIPIITQRQVRKMISGPSPTAVLYQDTVQDFYRPPYWTLTA